MTPEAYVDAGLLAVDVAISDYNEELGSTGQGAFDDVRAAVYYLQRGDFLALSEYFENGEWAYSQADIGYYYYYPDQKIHMGAITRYPLDFSGDGIYIHSTITGGGYSAQPYSTTGYYRRAGFNLSTSAGHSGTVDFATDTNFAASFSQNLNPGEAASFSFYITNDSATIYDGTQFINTNYPILGHCNSIELPEEWDSEENAAAPWDFYNDTLVPYIIDTYGDGDINNIIDWLVFPPGYVPETPTDPPEPATYIPGVPPVVWETVIEIDTNGDTYIDTVPITETGGDFARQWAIPVFPSLPGDTITGGLPPGDLLGGVSGIFGAMGDFFTTTGLLPVLAFVMVVAAIGFIFWGR